MTIRHFEDISSIRQELRALNIGIKTDTTVLSTIKRVLSTKQKILSASKTDVLLNVRDTGGKSGGTTVPDKGNTGKKVAFSVVQKLTSLVSDRQDKYKLAMHISELIRQNFGEGDENTGAVVKKLTSFAQELVEKTRKLYRESEALLNEQGNNNTPDDFKEIITSLIQSIRGEFDTESQYIKTKYYIVADNVPSNDGGKVQRFINMGYIEINPFDAGAVVRPLYIVVSRRKDNTGKQVDYIRTFTNKVLPAAILKTNLGSQFDTPERAFRILLVSLKADNVINTVDPVQVPIKKANLKYANPNILKNEVDEDNGVITFYLKNNVTSLEAANKIMEDIFVETKKLVRAVHPRAKNTIRATRAQSKKVRLKLEGGKSKVAERFFFKLMFGKADNQETIELPRDKMKQFMKTLDIENPDAIEDLNALLKNFLGIHVNTRK